MREHSAPLTITGVDPVLDFLDGALTRLGLHTAVRLPLLSAAEELMFAALALAKGQEGQVFCSPERPGGLRLSFRTRAGPLLPDGEGLVLPDRLSLRLEGAVYIIVPETGSGLNV